MKGILLITASVFFSLLLPAQDKFLEKADAALQRRLVDGQSAGFIILMRDQADISQAHALQLKNEKAHYVFDLLRDHAAIHQASLIGMLEGHGIPFQPMFVANLIKAEGNMEVVKMIAARDDVQLILSNEAVTYDHPFDDISMPGSRAVEWGIERINADDVWALGFRGQGVVIGGEDTGYQWHHPAIKKQYRGFIQEPDSADHNYNWHDAIHRIDTNNVDSINPCGLDVLEPCDDRGHGTHTMGTMVGLDGENQIGVAPEATWCGCRNMERGWGTPFTYIECFQWFLGPTDLNNENPDPSRAPHVINNSWSCPEREGCDSSNWEVMNLVINNLKAAGIVVVVSAGNTGSGCGTVSTPAAMFEGSFSVGATAINDTIAGFSSRGPVVVDSSFRLKPNVSAPGVGIRSATLDGGYGHSSGTSMAGPHVAGLVALMISANPDLAGKVDLIETIIEQTSVPKTTDQSCGGLSGMNVPNHTYGYGRVDALAAVEAALQLIVNTQNDGPHFQISMYPNPFVEEVIIEHSSIDEEPVIRVWDAQGRMIETQISKSGMHYKLNFSSTPAGIYFCHIITSRKAFIGKMIKL